MPGKLPLFVGKDALRLMKGNIYIETDYAVFPGIGDHDGAKLDESRAGHMVLPLLPKKNWSWTGVAPVESDRVIQACSTDVAHAEAHRTVRVRGSRVARELLLSSGKDSSGPLIAAIAIEADEANTSRDAA